MISLILSTRNFFLRNITIINYRTIITSLFILGRHKIYLLVTYISTNIFIFNTTIIIFADLSFKIRLKVLFKTFVIYSIIFELKTTSACNYISIIRLEYICLIFHFTEFELRTTFIDVC